MATGNFKAIRFRTKEELAKLTSDIDFLDIKQGIYLPNDYKVNGMPINDIFTVIIPNESAMVKPKDIYFEAKIALEIIFIPYINLYRSDTNIIKYNKITLQSGEYVHFEDFDLAINWSKEYIRPHSQQEIRICAIIKYSSEYTNDKDQLIPICDIKLKDKAQNGIYETYIEYLTGTLMTKK